MAGVPKLFKMLEQLKENGPAIKLVGREKRSAEEKVEVRCQEYVERPTALPGSGLDECHVNLIHIRPFLAVHLDADKVFVQKFSHFLAFKRFAFHDVAPMTGRIADADEDRFIFLPRFGEGFLAP